MPTEASESSKELDDAILKALQRRSAAGASSDEDDEALISSVVGAHLHSVVMASGTRSTLWIASAGLLAAAAAAALWVLPASSGTTDVARTSATPPTEVAPLQAMWLLESDQSPLQGTVVASDETCGVWGDTRSCLQPDGRAHFAKDGSLTLESGSLEVTAKHALVVLIDDIRVEVSKVGSTFTATRRAEGWEVEVEAGQLSVLGPGQQVRVLEAGQSARSEAPEVVPVDVADAPAPDRAHETKPASKPVAVPSADELLARARSQRAAKDFKAAAASYEQLVRAHGKSAKARAALVSLAQLYQGPLSDPAKALTHFERYLERGGPLSEEAHYGKIRALRSLGRDASAEIDAFLAAYPDTTHADALRAK